MKSENKFLLFLKKNAFYLVLAFCILAVALSVTLVLTLGNKTPATPDQGEEKPPVVSPDDPTDGDDDNDDGPDQPTVEEVVFIMPVNGTVLSHYSEEPVFNSTLNLFTAHKAMDFAAEEGSEVYAVYDGTVDGSSLYAERLAEYERYSADPNYKDVAFDRSTLGLKATHIRHNFDPKKGWYERAAQDAGYRAGHSVILEAEDHTVLHLKNIEGSWDGKKLEIGGAENGTSSNVRNALKHCATKPNCQTAVVYLPKGEYDFGEIRSGMARYYGLRGTDQFVEFEEIVIIAGEDIIYSQ